MKLEILGPAPDLYSLKSIGDYMGQFMKSNLPQKSEIFLCVAYAKETFTTIFPPDLERFVHNGGRVEAVIGIDSKGTSEKALRLLSQFIGKKELFLYHNPSDGTFHPKFYILKCGTHASVIIGSSNLTAGGLANNFEINVGIDLDLRDAEDNSFFTHCKRVFNKVKSSPSSELLNDLNLVTLSREGILSSADKEPGAKSGKASKILASMFGSSTHTKKNRRAVSRLTKAIMSLSDHDVSGKREPYFLIPLAMRDDDPAFWGWPGKFRPSKIGRFLERRFDLVVTHGGQTINEKSRIYFVDGRSEFRLRCKEVHDLGSSKVGSLLVISWNHSRKTPELNLFVVEPTDPEFSKLSALPFHIVNPQKKWIYA